MRKLLLITGAFLAASLALPGPANAQYPPSSCEVQVDSTVPVVGLRVFVCVPKATMAKPPEVPSGVRAPRFDTNRSLNALKPASTLTLTVQGTDLKIELPVTESLEFVDVPVKDLPAGTYTLVVSGTTIAGKPMRAEIPITVDPTAPRVATVSGEITVVTPPADERAVEVQGLQVGADEATGQIPASLKVTGAGIAGVLLLAFGYLGFTLIMARRRQPA